MSAVQVLKFPLSVDLAGFVGLLRRLNVPHRVSEESGQQVLWVPTSGSPSRSASCTGVIPKAIRRRPWKPRRDRRGRVSSGNCG